MTMTTTTSTVKSRAMHRRTSVLLALAPGSALVLAGCGGDDSTDSTKGGNVVVTVDPNEANSIVVPDAGSSATPRPGTAASTPCASTSTPTG